MGWLIALGILFLLALLPLGISLRYDSEGACVTVEIGPAHYRLYPRKKKGKNPENKQEPKKELAKTPQATGSEKKTSGGSLADFLPLAKTGLDFLCDLRRKIRVKELYLRWILAASDPADLGISYGRAWAALGNLMPQLEQLFVIRKRDVEVECDFTASESKCIARLDVTITLGRTLVLAAVYGIRVLKEYKGNSE